MIDAYQIGVELLLDDKIEGRLEAVASRFDQMQSAVDRVNAALRSTSDLIGTVSSSARGMATAWNTAAAAAERMAAAASRMGEGGSGGGSAGGGAMPLLPGSSAPRLPGAGGGGEPPDYNPGGFTMPGFHDPRTPLLEGPGAGIPLYPTPGGAGGRAGHDTHGAISSLFMGDLAAGVVGHAVKATYNAAGDIGHQAVLMQNQGGSDFQSHTQAVAAALRIQQSTPGISFSGAMSIVRDGYLIVRNMDEAARLAVPFAKSALVLHSLGDDDAAEAIYDQLRSGEIRGLLNHKNPDGSIDMGPLTEYVNRATQIAQSTGGRVNPSTYLAMLKNAGPEGLMMSPAGIDTAAILSMSLGGDKVGTGINALATQFIGGKMSQGAANLLEKAGIADASKVRKNGIGQVIIGPGGIKDQKLFQSDPFKWIDDVFEPAADRLGKTDQIALLNSIYSDLSRIPGARVAAEAIFQNAFVDRQLAFANATPGLDQAVKNLQGDPQNTASAFGNAFTALLATLGGDAMGQASAALKTLTGALNGLSTWAYDHPGAGRRVVDLGVAGGAAAIGGLSWKAIKWAIDHARGIGDAAAADASFAGGEAVSAGEGAIAMGGKVSAGALARLGAMLRMGGLLSLLDLSGDTPGGGDNSEGVLNKLFGGKSLRDSLLADGPLPVAISNPGAVTGAVTSDLARHQGLLPNGPSGFNMAITPPAPGAGVTYGGHQ